MNAKTSPEFRWLERGDGDAVMLLHGLMGAMEHWEPTIEALGEMCRAIAPALPIFDPALSEPSVPELGRHVVRPPRAFAGMEPLKPIRCPVLVVSATEDRLIPVAVQRRIVERYQADHIPVLGRGHMLPIEANWRGPIGRILEWLNQRTS